MVDIDRLKADVADLLIEVQNKREAEARKRRKERQAAYDRAVAQASVPQDTHRIVVV